MYAFAAFLKAKPPDGKTLEGMLAARYYRINLDMNYSKNEIGVFGGWNFPFELTFFATASPSHCRSDADEPCLPFGLGTLSLKPRRNGRNQQ